MEEKKAWQHGYEMDYLKKIEAYYSTYNSYTFSPFAQYKKNDIAADLFKGNLWISTKPIQDHDELQIASAMVIQTVKVASDIILYQNVKIGRKLPKDRLVTRLEGESYEAIQHLLHQTRHENTWAYIWAEDTRMHTYMMQCQFTYIGPKVTSFGEIYSIYFRNAFNVLAPRDHPKIDPIEWISCKRIDNMVYWFVPYVEKQLQSEDLCYTNHYSNYNAKKSWSALSLRGYSIDSNFITKPSEMNDKWQKEHEGEEFHLQDTPLYDKFDILKIHLPYILNENIHRIRFMKLEPNGGELKRHTDLVDVDSGLGIGKLARIHIPIITNDDVEFTSWNLIGKEQTFNMKAGEMWVLDTRKPHRVVNKGTTARIHLVIDVVVDDKLYNKILKS